MKGFLLLTLLFTTATAVAEPVQGREGERAAQSSGSRSTVGDGFTDDELDAPPTDMIYPHEIVEPPDAPEIDGGEGVADEHPEEWLPSSPDASQSGGRTN